MENLFKVGAKVDCFLLKSPDKGRLLRDREGRGRGAVDRCRKFWKEESLSLHVRTKPLFRQRNLPMTDYNLIARWILFPFRLLISFLMQDLVGLQDTRTTKKSIQSNFVIWFLGLSRICPCNDAFTKNIGNKIIDVVMDKKINSSASQSYLLCQAAIGAHCHAKHKDR